MWEKIAKFILRFRLLLILALGVFTAFMAYKAQFIELSYEFADVIPKDNQKLKEFNKFKEEFGTDGNIMVIGVRSDKLFDLSFFNDWYDLSTRIENMDGIDEVVSLSRLYKLQKNKQERKFSVVPVIKSKPVSQKQLDSVKASILSLPFYKGIIYNPETNATLMAVAIERKELDSENRVDMVLEVKEIADQFAKLHDVELHYSGLPYIRTFRTTEIKEELKMFLILALIITAIILFILFRSLSAVIFPLLVVMTGVIWSVGTIVLLGYKITLLTGLIPPLIVVIGIPNCVYLLNKYHLEFKKHGHKQVALSRMISRIGHVTFFTNLTTAIGFGVFYFTNSKILEEFGVVAGLNIAATFIISLIIIPVIFSYLPAPNIRHTSYLENKPLNKTLDLLHHWAVNHRKSVYTGTITILILAVIGMSQLRATGFILDDVEETTKEYQDLKFFERNFGGVMPFEVLIDTKKKNEVLRLSTLQKIAQIQDTIKQFPVFSKPVSIAEGMKFATQAFYNGNEKYYRLPRKGFLTPEYESIVPYFSKMETEKDLLKSFVDSSRQVARISVKVADIGSHRFPELTNQLRSKIFTVIDSVDYNVAITGTSVIANEGYRYLVKGLIQSLAVAFLLISLIMAYLFRSVKMLLISLVPNIIPLLITAGIMGLSGIDLKPSTVLVFSIAFGISVDYTIHFLAKYRQELFRHNWNISKTVSVSLQETGISMIYTSLILFFGFIIFTGSSFGGTVNLGILTSITLIVALLCNLALLPSILLSFERLVNRKALKEEPLLNVYNEEEDIELEKLEHRK